MKKLTIILTAICLTAALQAAVQKTVNCTAAGTLTSYFTAGERTTVTDLTITGTIDARDFKFIRDTVPNLTRIDMSAVNIATYTGTQGVETSSNQTYMANELPGTSFANFDGDATLTQIILPNSITTIYGGAFYKCNGLTTITIPASVTYMMGEVFSNCSNLTEIHLRNPVPTPIVSALGQNLSSLTGLYSQQVTLYVPIGASSMYNAPIDYQGWGLADFPNYSIEEEDVTALLENNLNSFKIIKEGRNILMTGLTIGNIVDIYTIQGYMMYSAIVKNETMSVQFPYSGLYIVISGTQSEKILI